MKQIRKFLAPISTFTLVSLSACSLNQMIDMAKKQELKVKPNPLEVHGDSVIFDVSAMLPVNMLKKNKLYTVKTFYKYGTADSQDFNSTLDFQDTEFPNQKVEQPKVTRKFSFFYEEKLKNGELILQGVASNLDKTKAKKTAEMPIGKGVITTSRLVKTPVYVAYADHGYNEKEELAPFQVEFFFEQGKSELRKSEVKGERGSSLTAFIANKNYTRTVTIYGSHSPEGSESINSKLAEDRATAIKKFYFQKMKQYDYKKMADSIKFETKAVFQNWDPFKAALKKYSGLTEDEKKQVLAVLDAPTGTYTEKEQELTKLPFYTKLLEDVYPTLRVSRTEIFSTKPKKTQAEINILSNAIANGTKPVSELTESELMYAATMTPLLVEKEKIYIAASKSTDSWQSHNNLGGVYLEMALKSSDETQKNKYIEKAMSHFNISLNKKPSAEATNNLGACYLLQNKKQEALSTYQKAEGMASSGRLQKAIRVGKGTSEIKFGYYGDAVKDLRVGADGDIKGAIFNLALAEALGGDLTSAEKSINNAQYVDKTDAMTVYLAAVISARQKKAAQVAILLAEAVKLDGSLREKALGDLEFLALRETEAFKNALK